MASSQFTRMIELGEWLEKFLDPKASKWQLVDLCEEGAKIIGVREKLSNKCEVSQFLREKLPEESIPDDKRESIKNKAKVFLGYPRNIFLVLKEIRKYSIGWLKILPEFETDRNPFLFGCTRQLRYDYGGLRDTIRKNGDTYVVEKSFLTDDNYMREVINKILPPVSPPDVDESGVLEFEIVPHYRKITAQIFFDFLLYGGQDYYGFCEHCDRFTLIRRKGRKKYCSDICRTASKQPKK